MASSYFRNQNMKEWIPVLDNVHGRGGEEHVLAKQPAWIVVTAVNATNPSAKTRYDTNVYKWKFDRNSIVIPIAIGYKYFRSLLGFTSSGRTEKPGQYHSPWCRSFPSRSRAVRHTNPSKYLLSSGIHLYTSCLLTKLPKIISFKLMLNNVSRKFQCNITA